MKAVNGYLGLSLFFSRYLDALRLQLNLAPRPAASAKPLPGEIASHVHPSPAMLTYHFASLDLATFEREHTRSQLCAFINVTFDNVYSVTLFIKRRACGSAILLNIRLIML